MPNRLTKLCEVFCRGGIKDNCGDPIFGSPRQKASVGIGGLLEIPTPVIFFAQGQLEFANSAAALILVPRQDERICLNAHRPRSIRNPSPTSRTFDPGTSLQETPTSSIR
jgi:hypothetical protein